MIRWTGKVGPGNLNSDYAKPVSVLAETRSEAVSKMLAAGGYRDSREGSVWISQMRELPASASLALDRIADAIERIASSQAVGSDDA